MSIKTQGTELFLVNDDLSLLKLSCPTAISGLGGPADQIETTCLDATVKAFEQGLKTPAQLSVPFNFDPAEVSHQDVIALYDSGITTNFMIALSDGSTDPTVDSDGDFDALAGRSNAVFAGYIADLTIDIATNEIVRGTMAIQRSGAITWTYKA